MIENAENDYLGVGKIGVDTDENELSEVLPACLPPLGQRKTDVNSPQPRLLIPLHYQLVVHRAPEHHVLPVH